MNILIYAGSTISGQEILAHLDAIILPPPAQGDILTNLDRYRPQAIGIIDMAFPRSAWISEIHYALRSGVAVYGAGAQGALRAVELQDYGMKGCGSVFNDFASGRHSDDAAVLCAYTEEDGRFIKASESLVNVLAGLRAAQKAGIIDAGAFDRLSQNAQTLYWRERSWQQILLPEFFADVEAHEEVRRWIKEHPVDIQKQDAIELLQAVAADKAYLQHNIFTPADRFGMLDKMYQRERQAQKQTGSVPLFSVAHHAAITHPNPLEVNFSGMNRDIVVFFAERMELEPSEAELDFEWTIFKHERSLDQEGVNLWLDENDMTPEAMNQFIRKNALCRKMHQWMIMKQGMSKATGPFMDQLRINGEYPQYADSSAKLETTKERLKVKYHTEFSRYSLEEVLAMRKTDSGKVLPWPAPYNQAADVLGITRDELFCELRRETFHQEQTFAEVFNILYEE